MTALNKLLSSFPFRLTLAYMGAFVLAAVVIVAFIGWRANELLTTKVIETLASEVIGLREQFQAGGPNRLRAVVAERAAEPGSGLYLLVDENGAKLAGNLTSTPAELANAGQGGVFRYVRVSDGAPRPARLAVGVPVAVPGGHTLIVGRDIEDQRQFADNMWQVALWSIGLLSLLGIGAGLVISRGVLARIEAVSETSRQIMAGDLSRRIPLSGSGDELDRLAAGLNGMLGRIEELMVALREVSDNIAHDLKTPLTRLRNRAEAALRAPDDVKSYREGLTKTIEEADELIRTFNSLLLIAKLEGGLSESMTPVDPATVIADVAELYEPVAEQAGLQLQMSSREGLCIRANRELVGQALANLVDNAIKYSTPAAQAANAHETAPPAVSIALEQTGDTVEMSVGDRGPGIAAEDRPRALQRFVRLEKSRSLPGSGLGLSLVAAVARLHGGSIRLEDNQPGLKAVLSFPACLPAGSRQIAVSETVSPVHA